MKKALTLISAVVAFCATTALAQAAPCAPSMTFTTGQTLTAAVLNSNPVTFSGCFSNIDYTNIGAAGLYPSELMPTTTGQGTVGGSVPITFPNGTITTTATSTNDNSTTVNTTTMNATTIPVVLTTSPVQQTVSGTTYTAPYDAQSTSGSANTHIEHGIVTTGAFSGSFACSSSTPFAKAFTASPTVIGILASATYPAAIYPGTVSATAFTLCGYLSGQTGGTIGINWIAVGE